MSSITSFRLPLAYTIPEYIEHKGERIPLPPSIRDNVRMVFNAVLDVHQAVVSLNNKVIALPAAKSTTTTVIESVSSGGGGTPPVTIPFVSVQSVNSNVMIGLSGASNSLIEATGGAGGITLSLITSHGIPGQFFILKKVDSGVGSIAINPNGAELIDTFSSWILSNQNQYVSIMSDGVGWQVFANN